MEQTEDEKRWPAAAVEMRPLTDLLPYAKNPRTHSAEQVALLKRSMLEFGFTNPVLVNEEGVVIAGHGRLLAAKALRYERVPVMTATGWTPAQVRAFRIADNQLTMLGEWEETLLSEEVLFLDGEDFDLELLGFSEEELAALERGLGEEEEEETAEDSQTVSLADRFGIPPFSVLNAREGWWQNRKRAWIAVGIKSELGRGESLLLEAEQVQDRDYYRNQKKEGLTWRMPVSGKYKKVSPDGSPRSATDYSNSRARGDGSDKAMSTKK